ncbi:N-fatty-acyl-amino acid synthase/hydrolase PM20D1-like [Daphnia pulex]|uniref:N-fatty-acyl-amino acid synthase/hydrolase PM20D1-like n=1 Tax=Daphnia pulex TaxID=6669 RepID=UPI001EDEC357|nr:N-fatty-acyl-amino acid synthase/hydrolase PM20D1-like [Daphnia pulex]
MCSKVFVIIVVAAISLIAVLLGLNTVTSRQKQFQWDMNRKDVASLPQLDRERIHQRAERLAKALTIQTISWERDVFETQALLKLHQHLKNSFPLLHSSPSIEVNVINGYSLLYKIRGSHDDKADNVLPPYMLAAHLDVVPVANGTWKMAEPFEGRIIDGVIYGRGALDDKSSVMGILEAVEFLIENKYTFQRTFYIGFGHDEEVSGFEGAGHIAKHLKSTGVDHLDFVLDEGYFVLEDLVEGVDELVSVIGVTEKGFATLELNVEMSPGHSSIPPKETAIGVLAKAVSALETNPHPSMFGNGPEMDFFSYISPSANIGHSVIFSNLWLLSPLLSEILARNPVTDAIQRTTTAVTIIQGGYKHNVIPGSASATVNHRIHPADSLDQVIEHNRRVINDPRVHIKVVDYYPPTPISPYGQDVSPFNLIASSVKQIYPSSVIAPACSPANTDLRRYVELSDHLYRITPTVLTPVTRGGIHGDDEQITVEHYHNFIRFYVALMLNADQPVGGHSASRHHREL